ncbi:hypothetical protein [Lysinibacter cavernae]|uniref:hypothetical protein n=1 Tax=Lysinibacter cavernae TaxID=1640652 RepID=UPI00360A936D
MTSTFERALLRRNLDELRDAMNAPLSFETQELVLDLYDQPTSDKWLFAHDLSVSDGMTLLNVLTTHVGYLVQGKLPVNVYDEETDSWPYPPLPADIAKAINIETQRTVHVVSINVLQFRKASK